MVLHLVQFIAPDPNPAFIYFILTNYHMHHIHFLGLPKLFWSSLYEHLLIASLKQRVFLVLSMPETIVSSPPYGISCEVIAILPLELNFRVRLLYH